MNKNSQINFNELLYFTGLNMKTFQMMTEIKGNRSDMLIRIHAVLHL